MLIISDRVLSPIDSFFKPKFYACTTNLNCVQCCWIWYFYFGWTVIVFWNVLLMFLLWFKLSVSINAVDTSSVMELELESEVFWVLLGLKSVKIQNPTLGYVSKYHFWYFIEEVCWLISLTATRILYYCTVTVVVQCVTKFVTFNSVSVIYHLYY